MAAPSAAAFSDATVTATAQPDSMWQALEDKVARQTALIERQNALIAVLKAKLAATREGRP